MKNYIFNYTEQNPLIVNNYPYGFRLKTDIRYWIESTHKKGDRFCSQTLAPQTGRWNKPKKSTYGLIGVMFTDERGHIGWESISEYSGQAKAIIFIDEIGGIEKLNSIQLAMYNSLMGIRTKDEFTGEVKRDFAVQWEKSHDKTRTHCIRITFDRNDGVQVREIFNAMKTLNQKRLNECFDGFESQSMGHIDGFVRICLRGGIQVATVNRPEYLEYLASDENILSEEV